MIIRWASSTGFFVDVEVAVFVLGLYGSEEVTTMFLAPQIVFVTIKSGLECPEAINLFLNLLYPKCYMSEISIIRDSIS
jgi:hypothetical protein